MLEKGFSPPRMSPYRAETENIAQAIELYVWNSEITAEFWKLIGYTEVALRNAISTQLAKRSNDPSYMWLFDSTVVNPSSEPFSKVQDAITTLAKVGKAPSEDRLVAELNFGFWQHLISKRCRHLWPTISRGFKGLKTREPKRLSDSLQLLRLFRNRIAHHYKIWHLDLWSQYLNILEVLELIDPALAVWVVQNEDILELLGRQPNCRSLAGE